MNNNAYVVVLILSYNGKTLLYDSISSYLINDYNNFDVVVIDNGSTDGTKEYVEENWPEVKVLRISENRGYSGGFNFGLNYAFNELNADYVLITNNDVKADIKVISSLVETALISPQIGFVTGKVYFFDNPNILQSVGKKHDDKLWSVSHIGYGEEEIGQYDNTEERHWCDDIFWLVNRKLYEKTGGYDTEFQFQAEDYEWQVRAKKLGYKLYYSHKAKIWHKDSMTIGKDSPFKSYYNFRNSLIVHMKHRIYSDYKYYYKYKRRHLLIVVLKNLSKFRFKYVYKSIQGFLSAIRWGLIRKRITILQVIK